MKNKTQLVKAGVSILLISLLSACVSRSPEQLSADAQYMLRSGDSAPTAAERQVPADVRAELRETMGMRDASVRALLEEPRFSVRARQMPVADFFVQVTDESPY